MYSLIWNEKIKDFVLLEWYMVSKSRKKVKEAHLMFFLSTSFQDSSKYMPMSVEPNVMRKSNLYDGDQVIYNRFTQCFGSDFSIFGQCGSKSGSWSRSGSRSKVLMTKNWEKFITVFFFLIKIAIYLSLGLHKGRLSYKRSLQPSKENIQHFKKRNCFPFFYICGTFLPSWIRIRLQLTKINADPCWSGYGSEILVLLNKLHFNINWLLNLN
jgi:hypothetical protein